MIDYFQITYFIVDFLRKISCLLHFIVNLLDCILNFVYEILKIISPSVERPPCRRNHRSC